MTTLKKDAGQAGMTDQVNSTGLIMDKFDLCKLLSQRNIKRSQEIDMMCSFVYIDNILI